MNSYLKLVIIFICGLLFSAGLFMNAGYFSHDEIAWGLKTISSQSVFDLNYYNIFHYDEFHYRPLNFNLWLLTSYYFFEIPQLFHLFLLCMGLINSVLIYLILKNEMSDKFAFLVGLLSFMMPSVVFVNGWIGTIADIFWFMCCCLSFYIYQYVRQKNNYVCLFISLLFYISALMFKETAVVFPGVIFLYIFYSAYKEEKLALFFNKKIDRLFFIICTLIMVFYLVLRLDFLFPSGGGGYGTSLFNVPIRMLEYFIYPFLFSNIEIHGLFVQHSRVELSIAFTLHLLLIVLLCKGDICRYFLYIGFYFVASVPILILDMSLPHYIYASGFVISFGLVYLLLHGKLSRFISLSFLVILIIHSFNIQKNYVFTGMYQNNFVNTLYSVIKSEGNKECIYLIEPDVGSSSWIAIRAIAFRSMIDDLSINKRVIFNQQLIESEGSSNICVLKLDKKGRVQYVEEKINDV